MTDNKQKAMDQKLDESLEDTFPASDPQSTLQPDVAPQDKLLQKNRESKGRPDEQKAPFNKDDYLSKE